MGKHFKLTTLSFSVLLLSTPSLVHAQGSGPAAGERWSYQCNDIAADAISLGDRGMQTFGRIRVGAPSDNLALYSSADIDPPSAIWNHTTNNSSFDHRTDSAEETPLHAAICSYWSDATQTRRIAVLRKFSSNSSNPDWSYTFPGTIGTYNYNPLFVSVTRNGQRILAASYDLTSNQTQLALFGPNSATPLLTRTLNLGQMRSLSMSADGSTVLALSSSTLHIVQGDSLLVQVSYSPGNSPCAPAMSGNGSVFGWGGLGVYKIFQRTASGGYALRVTRNLAGSLTFCSRVAISEDGSRFAAGIILGDSHTVTLECLDLNASLPAGAPILSMSDTLVGTGNFQNVVSDLALSSNGETLALGVWGDKISVPELSVYRPDQNIPVYEKFFGGSVMDLDLSGDGHRLVAHVKSGHANELLPGKTLRLFDLGNTDITVRGAPRLGSTVAFRHFANPNVPAILLASPDLANPPQSFPGAGTLLLERSSLSLLPMGNTNAAGVATLAVGIPNIPSLLGSSIYYQGFVSSPRRLGQDVVKVTALP